MSASMSPPPTPISQNPSDIAFEFLGQAPSAIGTVTAKAAPASHGHALSSNPAQPIGFGLQQLFRQTGGYSAGGGIGLFTNKFLRSLPIWTIEGFLGPGSNPGGTNVDAGVGFTDIESNLTQGWARFPCGIAGSTVTPGGLNCFAAGGNYLALPSSGQAIIPGLTPIPPKYFAMACDGSVIRCYWDGALVGTLPWVATPPAQFGIGVSCGTAYAASLLADEIRLSSVARYIGSSMIEPAEPFTADASTVLLWHLDNSPLGTWAGPFTGLAYKLYTGSGAFQTEDASGNDNVGFVGQSSSGGPTTVEITGQLSTVSPTPSGRVATNTVLSVQATSGDLVITDTAGNSLGVAVPQADGTSQLQISNAPSLTQVLPTNPPVSGTVYQNTTAFTLGIVLGVTASVVGTAQWALGPTDAPAAFGPATPTIVGMIEKGLSIPRGWYYSLTVTGTAAIGTASVLGT